MGTRTAIARLAAVACTVAAAIGATPGRALAECATATVFVTGPVVGPTYVVGPESCVAPTPWLIAVEEPAGANDSETGAGVFVHVGVPLP